MHVIHNLLKTESRKRFFVADGQLDVQKLRSVAGIFTHSWAWSQTRTVEEALAVIQQHPDFEPTPEELPDRLLATDYGHWREVVQWAGYLTLKFKLEADLEAEIQLIQTSITLAAVAGMKAVGLIAVTENPLPASPLVILIQRDGFPEVVWLDVEMRPQDDYDACPNDPDGLHYPDCGCGVWPQL